VTSILLATFAGASFGALTVAVQWGLRRGVDPGVGALVAGLVGAVASVLVATPFATARGVDARELWPFVAAGLIAPGASQIFLTLAVRHVGAPRAAIFMGTAPLISILLAALLLDEQLRPPLLVGAGLIVLGGVAIASEATRPTGVGVQGSVLALLCAVLFAARDNIIRWGALDADSSPVLASSATLVSAATVLLAYQTLSRREGARSAFRQAVPAFAPAGLTLALGYGTLLWALDRGRVSVVSPLNATGSLWAVLFAALLFGQSDRINRHTFLAAVLVVAGGALIGAFR
jgi:drug/metabolite transporter (DMT)-like permease